MDTTTLLSFLSGLGAGSILGAIVKHWLEQRAKLSETWLKEYKEAADGLLDAYREAAMGDSNAAQKSFARWEARLQLLASNRVTNAIELLKLSNPGSAERQEAHNVLIQGLREDLGIAKQISRKWLTNSTSERAKSARR